MPIHDADYERDQADFVADSLSHAGIWTDEDEQACSGGRLATEQDVSDTRPKAIGRTQCLSCGRSGGELTENGCPACGPSAEIGTTAPHAGDES